MMVTLPPATLTMWGNILRERQTVESQNEVSSSIYLGDSLGDVRVPDGGKASWPTAQG